MSIIKVSYDPKLKIVLKEGPSINENEDLVNGISPEYYSTFIQSNLNLKVAQQEEDILIIPNN